MAPPRDTATFTTDHDPPHRRRATDSSSRCPRARLSCSLPRCTTWIPIDCSRTRPPYVTSLPVAAVGALDRRQSTWALPLQVCQQPHQSRVLLKPIRRVHNISQQCRTDFRRRLRSEGEYDTTAFPSSTVHVFWTSRRVETFAKKIYFHKVCRECKHAYQEKTIMQSLRLNAVRRALRSTAATLRD